MINVAWIFVAFILVLVNAFFVAAEFGMVKLRHTRVQTLKKQYGLRGRVLQEVHKHLDVYLSACQLGITLASLGLGWVGEPAFAHLFQPFFDGFLRDAVAHTASLTTAFVLITFLHIVFGELAPKSLAIQRAEATTL